MFVLSATLAAQAQSDAPQPVATMKQLMVDVIHPASNTLLLLVNRGGPSDDKEWAEARRGAMTLAESGNLLIMRNRAAAWVADAKMLTDAGAVGYCGRFKRPSRRRKRGSERKSSQSQKTASRASGDSRSCSARSSH